MYEDYAAILTMKNFTVLYLMSDSYKPKYGTGIRFNDPIINENGHQNLK